MKRVTATRAGAIRCRRKFLRYFGEGFRDQTYIDWERGYKAKAHEQWKEVLDRAQFQTLLAQRKSAGIASQAGANRVAHEPSFLVREDGAA